MPSIHLVHHDTDFDRVFDIRSSVFVEELGMDEEEEMDGLDHLAQHYLAIVDGQAVGTARWRLGPLVQVLRLERIAVLPEFRGQGVATALAKKMIEDMPKGFPLEAKATPEAVPFFEQLGLEQRGEKYEVGGIEVVDMIKKKQGQSQATSTS